MYDTRILEKKLEDSATKNTDFAADGELTVTITVHEYRKLVEDSVKLLHTSMELSNTRSELNRLQIKYNELCMDRCDDPPCVEIE
ncbi:MAG: hypothetical protein UIH27_11080 [Ruminococcus sp.]|nr:hypothetical protein [Ruminococcus sp.]